MADPKGNLVTPVGYRADGSIHSLELTPLDELKISIEAIAAALSIEVSNFPNPQIVDGASPSIFRPTPTLTYYSNLNLPAGGSTQTVWTVPASQYHRMTMFQMTYIGTVAGVSMTAYISNGISPAAFLRITPPVSGQAHTALTNAMLSPGWTVKVDLLGATLNNDFNASVISERVY